MNTLLALIGAVAALWLAIYGFDTLDDTAIGLTFVGVFLFCLGPLMLWAVAADLDLWKDYRGEARDDE